MRKLALYQTPLENSVAKCVLCPIECVIPDGQAGVCRFRQNHRGTIYLENYGEIVDLAIEPIEKKPLYHFFPGSKTVSIGSNGCNMSCTFCQNYQVSQQTYPTRPLLMDELKNKLKDTIGACYTFNEPLTWYEFVYDTARQVREWGYRNVLNTNGLIHSKPLENLLPLIDAVNLDLKGFSNEFYHKVCGSPLEPILKSAIQFKQSSVKLEISHLVIPGANDHETIPLGKWILENLGPSIPIHLNSYFPRYLMTNDPTPTALLENLQKAYREMGHMYVYLGNTLNRNDTICYRCGFIMVKRRLGKVEVFANGSTCEICGSPNDILLE